MPANRNDLTKKRKKINKKRSIFLALVIFSFIFTIFGSLYTIGNSNDIEIQKTPKEIADYFRQLAWEQNKLVDMDDNDDYLEYNIEHNIESYTNTYDASYSFNPDDVLSIQNGYYKDGNNRYTFNNLSIGTSGLNIPFVTSYSGNAPIIISEYKGHRNCLLVSGTSEVKSSFSRTSGSIEFYGMYYSGGQPSYVQLLGDGSAILIDLWIYQAPGYGRIYYGNGAGGSTYAEITNFKQNEFNRFRIDFDCTTDTFSFSCNEIQILSDVPFKNDYLATTSNALDLYSASGRNVVYDAFGFSWENNYNIGDNLYQDLIGSEVAPISNYSLPLNSNLQLSSLYKGHDNILNLTSKNNPFPSYYDFGLVNEGDSSWTKKGFSFWLNLVNKSENQNASLIMLDDNDYCFMNISFYDNGTIFANFDDNSRERLTKISFVPFRWVNIYVSFSTSYNRFRITINYNEASGYVDSYHSSGYVGLRTLRIQSDAFSNQTVYLDAFDYDKDPNYEFERNFEPIKTTSEWSQTNNLEMDYPADVFEGNDTRFLQDDSSTENQVYIDASLNNQLVIRGSYDGSKGGSHGFEWNDVNTNSSLVTFDCRFRYNNFTHDYAYQDYATITFSPFGMYWYGAPVNMWLNGTFTIKIQNNQTDGKTYLLLDTYFNASTNWVQIKAIDPRLYHSLRVVFNYYDGWYKLYVDNNLFHPYLFDFINNGVVYTVDWSYENPVYTNFGFIDWIHFRLSNQPIGYNNCYRAFEIDSVALKNKNGGNNYQNSRYEYSAYSLQLPELDLIDFNSFWINSPFAGLVEFVENWTANMPSTNNTLLNVVAGFVFTVQDYAENLLDSLGLGFLVNDDEQPDDEPEYQQVPISIPSTNPIYTSPFEFGNNDYHLVGTGSNQMPFSNVANVGGGLSILTSSGLKTSQTYYQDTLISIKQYNLFDKPSHFAIMGVKVISDGKEYIPSYSYDKSSKGNLFYVGTNGDLCWRYSKTSTQKINESMSLYLNLGDYKVMNNTEVNFNSYINNNYGGKIELIDTEGLRVADYDLPSVNTETRENITLKSSSIRTQDDNSSGIVYNTINKIKITLVALANKTASYFTSFSHVLSEGLISAINLNPENSSLEFQSIDTLDMDFQEALIYISIRMAMFLVPSLIGYIFVSEKGIVPLWILMLIIYSIIGFIPMWMTVIQIICFIGMMIIARPSTESEVI